MHTYAQDTTVQKKFVDVSISLAGLGGDYVTNSVGIQAGVEFRLKNNVGMQCDLRYIFDDQNPSKKGYFVIGVDDLLGFAVNTEIKAYIQQFGNELKGGYFGGQIHYMYSMASQDEYQVIRNKIRVCGNVGWKYIAKSGFLFETSAGVGVQLISSYSTNKPSGNSSTSFEFPWSKPYDSGAYFYPDLSLNVRIGWRF